MRFSYIAPLCFGLVLVYLGAFGLRGFNLNSYQLHGLSLADSAGTLTHSFVNIFFQVPTSSGVYTDLKASISSSEVLYPPYPDGLDTHSAIYASVWIGIELVVNGYSYFMQIGWYYLPGYGMTGPQPFWSSTGAGYYANSWGPETNVGEVHSYEIRLQSDGWALIFDGVVRKVINCTVPAYMIMADEETTGVELAGHAGASGMINAGQIVFSNMYDTVSSKEFSFFQSYGAYDYHVDAGNNGARIDSATQLTLGWGLPTDRIQNNFASSPLPTSTPSPTSTPTPKPSSPSPSTPTPTPTTPAPTPSITIPTFNIDWSGMWKNVEGIVDANRKPLLAIGGLITLFSFIGLMLPQKRIPVQWY